MVDRAAANRSIGNDPCPNPVVQSFSSLSSIHPRRALDSRNRDANFHAFAISSD
jgi:hypothetical protein